MEIAKLEAGLNASLELQCRETMEELEQNTVRAGFEAGLRASRLWKLEQNNVTKKVDPFFGPQNVRKSRRANMGLPSSRFQPQLLLVKSASSLK